MNVKQLLKRLGKSDHFDIPEMLMLFDFRYLESKHSFALPGAFDMSAYGAQEDWFDKLSKFLGDCAIVLEGAIRVQILRENEGIHEIDMWGMTMLKEPCREYYRLFGDLLIEALMGNKNNDLDFNHPLFVCRAVSESVRRLEGEGDAHIAHLAFFDAYMCLVTPTPDQEKLNAWGKQ